MRRPRFAAPIEAESINPSKVTPSSITMPEYYKTAIDTLVDVEFRLACVQNKPALLNMSRSAFMIDMVECGIIMWVCWIIQIDPNTPAEADLVERAQKLLDGMPPHLLERCQESLKRHFFALNVVDDSSAIEMVEQMIELYKGSRD